MTPYYKKDTEDVLKALPYQKIFYSYVEYQSFKPLSKKAFSFDIKEAKTVLLFCGIANTYSLEDYLKRNFHYISVIQFADHHIFTDKDIDDIINKFNHLIGKNKFIVTTEKDVMRLRSTSLLEKFEETPLFYIPIRIKFHKEENGSFDEEIINYINKYDIKNIKDAGE